MKNRKFIIVGIVLFAAAIAAYILLRSKPEPEAVVTERVRKEIYNFDPKVCPGETVNIKMTDTYLRGLIEEGAEVKTTLNFYSCARLERGDIVLYRFSEFDNPVFRRVVAVEGDKFNLTELAKGTGWELTVNGKKVLGVKGEVYSFGGKVPPPLKLAADSHGGLIGKGEAILFSAFPPGDRDSGVFGLVATGDLVGKASIEIKK
jgi:hypothetical protein